MTANDSETKGPMDVTFTASAPQRPERYVLHEYNAKTHEHAETNYVREDLYTQSQRELAEAQRELAEVKRERDALIEANDECLRSYNADITRFEQERDRYRKLLKSFADRLEQIASEMRAPNGFTPRFFQLAIAAREALNPPTPNPSDVQASESDDAAPRVHPLDVDGVRHNSQCAIFNTPALSAQRLSCSCGAVTREGG